MMIPTYTTLNTQKKVILLSKIVVVGGGVSGLLSAIFASNDKNEVIILEKRDIPGKKILVTGNGRCNFWNEDVSQNHYNSQDENLISKIINDENKRKILDFFDRVNLVPYIKNGYYYPYSKEASTVRNILLDEVSNKNVKIVNNCKVKTIVKENDKFIINKNVENIICDKVIIATGSLSYYNDDSQIIGYDIAKSFGHKIVKVLPSLVQLRAKEKYKFLTMWKNARCEAVTSLISNGAVLKEEKGEIMLTDYGVSGICIFNLSSIATRLLDKNETVSIRINFAPWHVNFNQYVNLSVNKYENFKVNNFLRGFLHSKIIVVILMQTNIDKDKQLKELTHLEIQNLVNAITSFEVPIGSTNSFLESQVSAGGIPLSEIELSTMESRLEKGLYFAGEVIDVDGDCGGFNLAFAFISGLLAGLGSGKND